MTQANVDEDAEAAPPAADLATAEHLGRRVAMLAGRWDLAKTLDPAEN